MKHLWVDNKRIDSIPLLRKKCSIADKTNDSQTYNRIIREIIDAFDSGVLADWLNYQPEKADILSDEAEKFKELIACYNNNITISSGSASNQVQSVYSLLSFLTGIPVEKLKKQEKRIVKEITENNSKKSVLENVKWWEEKKHIFENFTPQDWSYVAITNTDLSDIITDLRKSNKTHRVVYLCQTEETSISSFIIDFRGISNVTFIGIGDPSVQYLPRAQSETIDLAAQQITIQDMGILFTLNKNCLRNFQNSTNFNILPNCEV